MGSKNPLGQMHFFSFLSSCGSLDALQRKLFQQAVRSRCDFKLASGEKMIEELASVVSGKRYNIWHICEGALWFWVLGWNRIWARHLWWAQELLLDVSHTMSSCHSQQGAVGHDIAQNLHLRCLHRRVHCCSHICVNQDPFQELGCWLV